MAIAALLAIVCNLEANAIGVTEERRPIVRRVLRIGLCRRSFDARRAQLLRNIDDIGLGFNAKTEMVEPWSIRVVSSGTASWAKSMADRPLRAVARDSRLALQNKLRLRNHRAQLAFCVGDAGLPDHRGSSAMKRKAFATHRSADLGSRDELGA